MTAVTPRTILNEQILIEKLRHLGKHPHRYRIRCTYPDQLSNDRLRK